MPTLRVIEKVKVGKRGDGTLIRVEGLANWFSVICVRGKQHEISTGTPDLKLAKRFHRQKLDELAADRQGLKQFTTPQHQRLQFGSLLDDLVSDYRVRRVKSLGSALSHIKPLRDQKSAHGSFPDRTDCTRINTVDSVRSRRALDVGISSARCRALRRCARVAKRRLMAGCAVGRRYSLP